MNTRTKAILIALTGVAFAAALSFGARAEEASYQENPGRDYHIALGQAKNATLPEDNTEKQNREDGSKLKRETADQRAAKKIRELLKIDENHPKRHHSYEKGDYHGEHRRHHKKECRDRERGYRWQPYPQDHQDHRDHKDHRDGRHMNRTDRLYYGH